MNPKQQTFSRQEVIELLLKQETELQEIYRPTPSLHVGGVFFAIILIFGYLAALYL